MKFSSFVFFSFASLAFAAPAPVAAPAPKEVSVEVRQGPTVVDTVVNSVNAVVTAINTNVQAIDTAVDGITGAVSAEVTAAVRANLVAIRNALQTATTEITGATTNALGVIISAASGLSQAQIDQLAAAVQSALDALSQVEAIIDVTATDLTPALAAALQAEINAIRNTINPFFTPLLNFARAVRTFSARVGVTVLGLAGVVTSVTTSVNTFLASLGLGQLLNLLFP